MKSTTHRKKHNINFVLPLLVGSLVYCTTVIAAIPANKTSAPKSTTEFAKVGDTIITWQDYNLAYKSEAGNRFYHAKPKEEELANFQRQVADKLVTDALLTQEAKRRKIKPDDDEVNQGLQKYDQRFANDPQWPDARSRVIPIITKRLQEESMRKKLEEMVRDIPEPSAQQVHAYYDTHQDKFTSPPQPRVSIILLSVDPAASEEEWNAAMEEGKDLVKRLRTGEDFAALARQYSSDRTAEDGGDMGYLHAGMLPGLPELVISKLTPGDIAEPVKLLEGVAIFKLVDRIPAALSNFDVAQQRASELLLAEQKDQAWNALIEKLKKKTAIYIDESRFSPMPSASKNIVPSIENKTDTTTVK